MSIPHLFPIPRKTGAEWDELIQRFGREATEIGLKYISWSILLAAIRVARIKAGSIALLIGEYVVVGFLYVHLYCNVMRLQILVDGLCTNVRRI